MPDYGAKGSVPGFDVKTVVDYLQLFNSSWPSIKIGLSGQFSGTVTHNLGYPPFYFVASPDGRVNQFAGLDTYGVNSTTLTRVSGSGTPRYYICRLDLTTSFDAPIIQGASIPQQVDEDYGLKITKPGKSVYSTDMRDFALNSSARSLMIHKVAPSATVLSGGNYIATIAHGLPYTPIAFVFILPGVNTLGMDADKYYIVPPPVGVSGFYYTVDSTNVSVVIDPFYFSTAPFVSVVILKDPLQMQNIAVTYP